MLDEIIGEYAEERGKRKRQRLRKIVRKRVNISRLGLCQGDRQREEKKKEKTLRSEEDEVDGLKERETE